MAEFALARLNLPFFRWSIFIIGALLFSNVHAASAKDCQIFLQSQPVRAQCGPTCITHTLVSLVETHLQQPLSIEYALLAQLVYEIRTFTPPSFDHVKEIRNEFRQYETRLSSGSKSLSSVLFYAALSGFVSEKSFLSAENREWFRYNFGAELSETGILKLRKQFVKDLGRLLQKCVNNDTKCAEAIRKIHDPYSMLQDWFVDKESEGRALWAREGPKLTFDLFSTDEIMVEEAKTFIMRVAEYKKAHPVVFNFSAKLKSINDVELHLDESLSEGFPAAVIMHPVDQAPHSEIATHRLDNRSMVTRNTALIRRLFWYRPAPLLIRSQEALRNQLIGVLTVRDLSSPN